MPRGRRSGGGGGQREHGGARGQRRSAGQREHAVHADEDAGSRQAVDREQRGHDREAGADQHDAAVVAAHADDRERERDNGRAQRADTDADEVHRHAEHDHAVADAEQQPDGQDDADDKQKRERDDPLAEKQPHTRHNRHESAAARTSKGGALRRAEEGKRRAQPGDLDLDRRAPAGPLEPVVQVLDGRSARLHRPRAGPAVPQLLGDAL